MIVILKLYYLGGVRWIYDIAIHEVTNEVWRYNGICEEICWKEYCVPDNCWQLETPLRQVRKNHRTVVIDGYINHVGGCKTDQCDFDLFRFKNWLIVKRL